MPVSSEPIVSRLDQPSSGLLELLEQAKQLRERLAASRSSQCAVAPYPDWAGINETVLCVMFDIVSFTPDGRLVVRGVPRRSSQEALDCCALP